MSDLISFGILACEKVLVEADGVASAIRLLDLVFVASDTEEREKEPFLVSLLVQGRFSPGANRDCYVQIGIIGPAGESVSLQRHEIKKTLSDAIFPSTPEGFNLTLQIAIVPKTLGTCFIWARIEEEGENTLVKTPITFLPSEPPPVPESK